MGEGYTLEGIAYDPINNKIYYCDFFGRIWRANIDGTDIEALQSNIKRELKLSAFSDPSVVFDLPCALLIIISLLNAMLIFADSS